MKSKKKKKKKKKKRSSPLFLTFSCFHFQFSTFSSQFSPLFPFFLASFFPVRQQKFPGQKSLGGTLPPLPPPPPPPVTPLPRPRIHWSRNKYHSGLNYYSFVNSGKNIWDKNCICKGSYMIKIERPFLLFTWWLILGLRALMCEPQK